MTLSRHGAAVGIVRPCFDAKLAPAEEHGHDGRFCEMKGPWLRWVAIAGVLGLGDASATASPITFPMRAELRGQFHPATDGVACPVDPARVCGLKYRGDGTFTGDLQGHVRFWATLWFASDGGAHGEETFVFTGTVRNCGSGTFAYHVRPDASESRLDPARGGITGTPEPWAIATGSGSTGLPGIGGHGTGDWLIHPDGTFVSAYSGTITCEPSGSAALAEPPRQRSLRRRSCPRRRAAQNHPRATRRSCGRRHRVMRRGAR